MFLDWLCDLADLSILVEILGQVSRRGSEVFLRILRFPHKNTVCNLFDCITYQFLKFRQSLISYQFCRKIKKTRRSLIRSSSRSYLRFQTQCMEFLCWSEKAYQVMRMLKSAILTPTFERYISFPGMDHIKMELRIKCMKKYQPIKKIQWVIDIQCFMEYLFIWIPIFNHIIWSIDSLFINESNLFTLYIIYKISFICYDLKS